MEFVQSAASVVVFFLLPLYWSFQAIQRKDDRAHVQWLSYWIICGLFGGAESTLSWLLAKIPAYGVLKLLVAVWLSFPGLDGATLVYERVIKPAIDRYESTIDDGIMRTSDFVKQKGLEVIAKKSKLSDE